LAGTVVPVDVGAVGFDHVMADFVVMRGVVSVFVVLVSGVTVPEPAAGAEDPDGAVVVVVLVAGAVVVVVVVVEPGSAAAAPVHPARPMRLSATTGTSVFSGPARWARRPRRRRCEKGETEPILVKLY
jgi:hypothetical protein